MYLFVLRIGFLLTSNNSSYFWLLLCGTFLFKSDKYAKAGSQGPHLEVDDLGQVKYSIMALRT